MMIKEFVEDPTDYDTVSIATLRDPEGNLIQLLQPARGRLLGAR